MRPSDRSTTRRTERNMRWGRRLASILAASATLGSLSTARAYDPLTDIIEGTETNFCRVPMFFTSGGVVPPGLVVPLKFESFPDSVDPVSGIPRVPLIMLQQTYSANGDIDLAPFVPGGLQDGFENDTFDARNEQGDLFFGKELASLRGEALLANLRGFRDEDFDYNVDGKYNPPGANYLRLTCNVGARMLTGFPAPESVASVGDPAPTGSSGPTVAATNGKGLFMVTGPLATFWNEQPLSTYETWIASYGITGDLAREDADPDGDHATNRQEFEAGTDPGDPSSVLPTPQELRLTILSFANGVLKFQWESLPGRTYEVLNAGDLTVPTANWSTVQTIAAQPNGGPLNFSHAVVPGVDGGFFRVKSR